MVVGARTAAVTRLQTPKWSEMEQQQGQQDAPLVVDLDGTLISTDMLYESANELLARSRTGLPRLLMMAAKGRASLKSQLASVATVDVSVLPYKAEVLELIRSEHARGRRTVLATATAEPYALAVANHLGVFDEVIATTSLKNVKAERKAAELVDRFGEAGFDYVGDSRADLAVWSHARSAIVVSPSGGLERAVRRLGIPTDVIRTEHRGAGRAIIAALRPHQWVKNLLIFVPLVAGHYWTDPLAILHAAIAFVAFGLAASSVYVLNDLVDVQDDRHHHRKRARPFASGELGLRAGWILWPILLAASLAIAVALLPILFVAVLVSYIVLTIAYSFELKQRAVLDVTTLAALYTLRVVAGSAAIAVELTFWLLTFSTFFFLSLALIKRFSELKAARDKGATGRIRGRGYSQDDLELVSALGVSSGLISVLVFALYIQDGHTTELYRNPQILWLVGPVLLVWIARAWLITHRGEMHDDPIIFAIKDRVSWIMGFALLLLFIGGSLIP